MQRLSINSLGFSKSNSAFSPSALPGLTLWLDSVQKVYSNAGTTLATDGQTVQQWNDNGSAANNFSQSTGSLRPTYRSTGGPNSKPTVEFDGTDDYMLATSNLTLQETTIFVVGNKAAAGSGYSTLFRATNTQWLARMSTAGNVWGCWMSAEVTSDVTMDTTFRVYTLQQKAPNNIDFVTNGTVVTKTNGTAYEPTAGNTTLGRNFDLGQGFNGKVSELIVYNRSLTSAERSAVERYLGTKWGITVA